MKYIVDFQKTENLCCCNRKEFQNFDEFYSFVCYWLKRPEIIRYEIQKGEILDE